MKIFFPVILLFTACSPKPKNVDKAKVVSDSLIQQISETKDISDPTNTLNGKTEILELEYIVWGCACANWITLTDFKKHQDKLEAHCIFIEPASENLKEPIYFDPQRHFIRVMGQSYVKPDYPKGTTKGEEQLDKAKVFRYVKIDVLKKNIAYSHKHDTTLNLSYNAIGCTCAQWSSTKPTSDTAKEYYYLEPANNNLLSADSLWNGNNLPLQIQVVGQIISYSGYPTGFNPMKGNPEAANVFRYTKIKVLKNGQRKKGR